MKFISLCWNLIDESGHNAAYSRSFTQALTISGHENLVLVPRNCIAERKLGNWHYIFPMRDKKNNAYSKIKYLFELTIALFKFSLVGKNNIIFLESFTTIQFLLTITYAFYKFNNINKLCFLFRNNNDINFFNKIFYKVIARVYKFIFPRKLHLYTDSDYLKTFFEEKFGIEFTTLPIPHTDNIVHSEYYEKNLNSEIILWWPGAPRSEKGLKIINIISQKIKNSSNITLYLSEKSKGVVFSDQVKAVSDPMSESQYMNCLLKSDFILLPYDKKVYSMATSGIFVESIFSGKIPLVSEGTWMALELLKNNLPELIFDWTSLNFLDQLSDIASNPNIIHKLKIMNQKYINYHNISSYSDILHKSLMEGFA